MVTRIIFLEHVAEKPWPLLHSPHRKKTSCYQGNLQEISHTDHSAKQTEKRVAIIATGQYQFEQLSEVSFKQTKVGNK